MEFEKQCRDGEACRGVIKKLFPSKRYGFAVCECAKHTGEAHFNYSDLDLPEQERSCLAVGWRIDFNVVEQHKKTDHCDYRAIQVKPVDVMVVQCEVTDVWENEIAILTCRELTGKTIYVTRNKYNGKFESEAVTRRDTCRAAVTWEQMKQKKTFALHCSQDTVSPTNVSPFRPKFKTPEKRLRRTDGHCTFPEPLMNASSSGYLDDMFMPSVCDHSDMLVARSGQDSGLETPEDPHQANSATAARSFGGPNLRVLTSTPTHKTDNPKPNHESGSSRYPISARTSPIYSQVNKVNRANSTGSVGSNPGANVTSHGYGNKFHNGTSSNSHHGINPTLNGEEGKNITQTSVRSSDATAGNDGHGGESNHSLLRSNSSPGEALLRENRSCASRRNLDQEFETFYASPRNSLRVRSPTSPMRSTSSYSEPTSKMMSMLATHEQTRASDAACDSALAGENSGRYNSDSLFGLYDANNASDEIDIYTVRNHPQHNSYRPSWEHSLGLSSPPNTAEQLNHAGHRISLESKGSSVVRPLGGENLYSDMRPGSSTDFGI